MCLYVIIAIALFVRIVIKFTAANVNAEETCIMYADKIFIVGKNFLNKLFRGAEQLIIISKLFPSIFVIEIE